MKPDSLLPWVTVLALSEYSVAQAQDQQSALPASTLPASVQPAADAKVIKVFVEDADCDETGPLHIVYDDAVDVVEKLPPKEQRKVRYPGEIQEGFAEPQVARDKETVGWTETYDHCCQSYPIPRVLTLYRSGRIIRRIQQGQVVWSWMFVAGGKRVAVEWGPTHGTAAGDYQLYAVQTGRMLSEAYGDEVIQKLDRNAPNWAKRLEKKYDGETSNPNRPCLREKPP